MPVSATLDRPRRREPSRVSQAARGVLFPLDLAYGQAGLPAPRLLYGRRTEVFVDGRNVGDIVEILPPA